MRTFSMAFAGLIFASSIAVVLPASAAENPAHRGMSKAEAYRLCQQEHFNRAAQMRACIAEKMHGG